jgi:hypothetical protein
MSILNLTKTFLYSFVNDFMRCIIILRFRSTKLQFTYVGNSYSGYWFPEYFLNQSGTIYGIGLGLDSSFEQELVKKGYKFFGFEPENESYLKSKQQFSDSKSEIYNFGIGTSNSYLYSRGSNHSIAETYRHLPINKQLFQIRSLWSVCEKLKLLESNEPRVLKMNIEGAEKEILEKFITNPLPFQIVIFQAEFLFHLRFYQFYRRSYEFKNLWNILKNLEKMGYKTINVSKNQITLYQLGNYNNTIS